MWALASRWIKLSLLYGGLGVAYWLTLLTLGKTPAAMLHVMPAAAALSFIILLAGWLLAMRHPAGPGKPTSEFQGRKYHREVR
jgi:hypothetical protein